MAISSNSNYNLKSHHLKYSFLVFCLFLKGFHLNHDYWNSNEKSTSWKINTLKRRACIQQPLSSSIPINLEDITIEEVERLFRESYSDRINSRGILTNEYCGKEKVAIIVPYKNRPKQIGVFLRHMHPFLQKQNTKYKIFIVNQTDSSPFNRALLLNIGHLESLKRDKYTCFVFSDVDLLPENEHNQYDCDHSPEHLSQNIKSNNYQNMYDSLFGGVSALSREHFQKVNGYANVYWGWGAEDDELYNRLITNGLKLYRKDPSITRYTDNRNHHSRHSERNPLRFRIINKLKKLNQKSGLENAVYKVESVNEHMLFTEINVDLVLAFNDYLKNWEPLFKQILLFDSADL